MTRGRKLKLNQEIIEKTVRLLSAGNYANTVCDYLGIGETTYYRWLQEGEKFSENKDRIKDKDKLLKIEFYESVKRANATAEIRAVSGILTAGEENWTALAWFLERKFSDRWSKKEKIEHSGRIDGKQEISLSHLTDEQIKKELAKLSDE